VDNGEDQLLRLFVKQEQGTIAGAQYAEDGPQQVVEQDDGVHIGGDALDDFLEGAEPADG